MIMTMSQGCLLYGLPCIIFIFLRNATAQISASNENTVNSPSDAGIATFLNNFVASNTTYVTSRQDAGAAMVDCHSGADLATAFATPAVQIARILSNIILADSDWSSIATPFLVQRNLTVTGVHTDPVNYPVIDMGLVRGKVTLGRDVVLNFTRVVLMNYRKWPLFQGPGIDLVYNVEGGDALFGNLDHVPDQVLPDGIMITNVVAIEQAAVVQNLCIPVNETLRSVSSAPRARGDNGTQQAIPRVKSPPGADMCTNDTSRWDLQRCWPAVGLYVDIYGPCINIGSNSSGTYLYRHAGYKLKMKDAYYLCERVMSDECAKEYTVLGCFARMMQAANRTAATLNPTTVDGGRTVQQGTSGTEAAAGTSGSAGVNGASQEGKGKLLAIVLPCVLGGGLVIAVAAAWVVWAARQRQHRGLGSAAAASGNERWADAAKGAIGLAGGSTPTLESCIVAGESGGGVEAASTKPSTTGARAAAVPSARTTAAGQGPCSMHHITNDAPITQQTPLLPVVDLDVQLQIGRGEREPPPAPEATLDTNSSVEGHPTSAPGEVHLLNNQVLGAGTYGRVVVGVYNGQRVAVKLLKLDFVVPLAHPVAAEGKQIPACNGASGDGSAGKHGDGSDSYDQWRLAFPEVQALIQEIEVLARCQHPNIVRLLAACLKPPQMCLVMEIMDTSLDHMLHGERGRVLSLPKVLHIGIQIAEALSYMHPTILHRDLKPGNVLISQPDSPTPLAKLADFGVSRLLNTVLVTQNPLVGTVPYMAPETFDVNNCTITDRADIYALGNIMWEMLTGARPWAGMTALQIASHISISRQHLPMQSLPKERCPPKLRALIVSCWEYDPARRPAAAEVVKRLLVLVQQKLTS